MQRTISSKCDIPTQLEIRYSMQTLISIHSIKINFIFHRISFTWHGVIITPCVSGQCNRFDVMCVHVCVCVCLALLDK